MRVRLLSSFCFLLSPCFFGLALSGCPGSTPSDAPDASSARDGGPTPELDAASPDDTGADMDAGGDDAGTTADAGELSDAGDLADAALTACGAGAGACGADELCQLAAGATSCGAPGVCVPRPTRCPAQVDPVCGCDGVDYPNPCRANAAGTDFVTRGTCTAPVDCSADQAVAEGSCRSVLGYRFDGMRCESLIGCTCTGADCATLPATEEACYAAHASCPCVIDRAFGEGACDLSFGWAWNGTSCVDVSGCTCTGADCGALASDEATCMTERATCRSPSGRAFACGPDQLCALGAEYCQAFAPGKLGAITYSCQSLPTGTRCQARPSCATCFATPPAGGTCSQGSVPAEITISIAAP